MRSSGNEYPKRRAKFSYQVTTSVRRSQSHTASLVARPTSRNRSSRSRTSASACRSESSTALRAVTSITVPRSEVVAPPWALSRNARALICSQRSAPGRNTRKSISTDSTRSKSSWMAASTRARSGSCTRSTRAMGAQPGTRWKRAAGSPVTSGSEGENARVPQWSPSSHAPPSASAVARSTSAQSNVAMCAAARASCRRSSRSRVARTSARRRDKQSCRRTSAASSPIGATAQSSTPSSISTPRTETSDTTARIARWGDWRSSAPSVSRAWLAEPISTIAVCASEGTSGVVVWVQPSPRRAHAATNGASSPPSGPTRTTPMCPPA